MDAIELVTADHRRVAALFESLDAAAGDQQRVSIREQIVTSLSRHVEAEELLLYPLARRRLGDGDPLVETALGDHQELRGALEVWGAQAADDANFTDQAERVRSLLQEHVEEEEGVLLPKLGAAATAEELLELGSGLAAASQ